MLAPDQLTEKQSPPRAAGRGQVHVFGRRFSRQRSFTAEKWTSPQLTRERLQDCIFYLREEKKVAKGTCQEYFYAIRFP